MYLTALFLPLFSAFCSGLLGRKLGTTGSKIISVSCLFLAAILSIICFGEVMDSTMCWARLFSIYIIAVAGAESALGLALLVAFYRTRGSILLS